VRTETPETEKSKEPDYRVSSNGNIGGETAKSLPSARTNFILDEEKVVRLILSGNG
jgi:hypothetical protein